MRVPEKDKICGNCRFRDYAQEIIAKVKRPWGISYEKMAPCAADAIEADAGDSVVYLGAGGNCLLHADAFEPSNNFMEELEEDAASVPPSRAVRFPMAQAARC